MESLSKKTISLGSYSQARQLPRFLCISSPEQNPDWLRSLTPRIMQWSAHIWIMDLRPCISFWNRQARKHRSNPVSLLEKVLRDASSEEWLGVLACHPWQAVFMLQDLKQKRIHTPSPDSCWLINLTGPFGGSFYRDASIESWFQSLETLSLHWEKLGRRFFQPARFRSQISRMRLSMERLGVRNPDALKQAPAPAIRRRFGSFLAEAWSWTFWQPDPSATHLRSASLFATDEVETGPEDFPWADWSPPVKPGVNRSLETPVLHWEQCEPLLKEDLDKLCQEQKEDCGVTILSWEITFDHMKSIALHLNFRHPHRLRKEAGHHTTVLNQARCQFETALEQLRQREEDLDFPPDIPVISWRLSVDASIRCSGQLTPSLWGGGGPEDQLQSMENRLPVPLEQYDLAFCFEAPGDFRISRAERDPEVSPMWTSAAYKRPLFVYDAPQDLLSRGHSAGRIFLERVSLPWWKQTSPGLFSQDFFLIQEHGGSAYWAAKTCQGQWLCYGIYS